MVPGEPPKQNTPTSLPSSLDLQLSILRTLPTPVVVFSSLHVAIFANRAAERLLGTLHPINVRVGNGVLGRRLEELGVRILAEEKGEWKTVLGQLSSKDQNGKLQGHRDDDGEVSIQVVDVVVDNPRLKAGKKDFRVLSSMMMHDNELLYTLSFESSTHTESRNEGDFSPSPRHGLPTAIPLPTDGMAHLEQSPTTSQLDNILDTSILRKSVFDSCSTPAFVITPDSGFYLANQKARELLGDVMGGRDGQDGPTLREKLPVWDENFTRKLKSEEFPSLRLVRNQTGFKDFRCGFIHYHTKRKVVMSVTGECLYDDDTGEFVGGVCWCKDLQEYSDFLSQQQQRKLESHETICDLMPHMVWTTNFAGDIDYCSQRWYDFTGLTKEETFGHGFERAVHPEDLPRLLEQWRSHTQSATDCHTEVRYRRHDGIYRWMRASACPLLDDDGNLLKWYGTTTDIHDLVMQRIEARNNKLQMLTVLAHAEVNLFAIDKDRIVTMAEGGLQWDSVADNYDVTNKSTLVGQDAIEVARKTQPGGISGYETNVLDVLSGKVKVAQSEDTIGDRVYRTRVVAELQHGPEDGAEEPRVNGVLGLSIDVTDMKARAVLETDNSRLMVEEQQARDSNRIKSQFLANMSHELRTPTAGVIGMVELLNEDTTLSVEQRDYVNSIELSAKALLTIVNDILDFSKIESGRLDIEEVNFSLSKVLDELCKLLGMFAQQKGLQFIYENNLDEELQLIGDPGRTRQILSNLLTNALKFTAHGHVKLIVSATKANSQLIDDKTIEVQFVVEDTGIGIEQSVLDRLFRPFSQGDSSTARLYGGTGLGLTISRNLANLMNGSITLHSTPQIGSKATFTVPFKIANSSRKSSIVSTSPPNPGFKYYSKTSRSPAWTAPPLAQRGPSQALLNQQISNSVNTYIPVDQARGVERHGSVNAVAMGLAIPETLSMEQRKDVHVLVVEDNAINQKIAIKNIRNLGFPVTAVWNGREALTYLLSPSSTHPKPAIILMDVQMPVMDGYEATQILRTDDQYASYGDGDETSSPHSTQLPVSMSNGVNTQPSSLHVVPNKGISALSKMRLRDIPVIAMTASAIQGDKEKCHEAGMDDYLAKPVQKARLEEMLVKWAIRER